MRLKIRIRRKRRKTKRIRKKKNIRRKKIKGREAVNVRESVVGIEAEVEKGLKKEKKNKATCGTDVNLPLRKACELQWPWPCFWVSEWTPLAVQRVCTAIMHWPSNVHVLLSCNMTSHCRCTVALLFQVLRLLAMQARLQRICQAPSLPRPRLRLRGRCRPFLRRQQGAPPGKGRRVHQRMTRMLQASDELRRLR